MTSIKVAIKVRPLIQREKDENATSQWTVLDENTIKSHTRDTKLTFGKLLRMFLLKNFYLQIFQDQMEEEEEKKTR